MNFNKIKTFCRKFRITLGLVLVIAGIVLYMNNVPYAKWLFLGIIPFLVGVTNFCPLCLITKRCDISNKK